MLEEVKMQMSFLWEPISWAPKSENDRIEVQPICCGIHIRLNYSRQKGTSKARP
jgi:hypothetical protein